MLHTEEHRPDCDSEAAEQAATLEPSGQLVPRLSRVMPIEGTSTLEGEWRDLVLCSRPEARARVPFDIAERYLLLPLALRDEEKGEPSLLALCGRPLDAADLQAIRFQCGVRVEGETAAPALVVAAIRGAYQGTSQVLRERSEQAQRRSSGGIERPAPDLAASEPVPLLLEGLLARADTLQASDIHLEPFESGLRVRFRVYGALEQDDGFFVSREIAASLFRRLKLLAALDTTKTNEPQEGGFTWESVGEKPDRDNQAGHPIRIRVSCIPQLHGEKAVLRLLDQPGTSVGSSRAGAVHDAAALVRLGMSAAQARLLLLHLAAKQGAILIAGPTGSGKSTLLYAVLQLLNDERRNIVTLEDPVERILPGINQLPVDRAAGRSFAAALAPILRQDPDVLMIGEIREAQAAETALTAAITGHLVLSTVHAGNVFEVFARLKQFDAPSELVATSLRLVIAQRLVPLNCRRCAQREPLAPGLARLFGLEPRHPVQRARGCARCRGTGVAGRRGIFEFLPVTAPLRELLLDGSNGRTKWCSLRELRQAAHAEGFQSFIFALRELLAGGEVAPERACEVVGVPPAFLASEFAEQE